MSTHTETDHLLDPEDLGRHLDRLRLVARGLCSSPHDAEDLVQDALVAVLRRPRRVRGDDLTYLTRALRNTFVSRHRRTLARPVTVAMPDELDRFTGAIAPSVEAAVMAREVLAGIAALPPAMRDAIATVDLAGYGCRDAATKLGVREGTIMSRCFRARRKLAPLLDAA